MRAGSFVQPVLVVVELEIVGDQFAHRLGVASIEHGVEQRLVRCGDFVEQRLTCGGSGTQVYFSMRLVIATGRFGGEADNARSECRKHDDRSGAFHAHCALLRLK